MNIIPDELLRSFEAENGAAGDADGGEAKGAGPFPQKVSLAMSYVPSQRFDNLYGEDKALARGTLFACLDLPFYGGKGR